MVYLYIYMYSISFIATENKGESIRERTENRADERVAEIISGKHEEGRKAVARKRRGESCDLWEVTGQLCVLWLSFCWRILPRAISPGSLVTVQSIKPLILDGRKILPCKTVNTWKRLRPRGKFPGISSSFYLLISFISRFNRKDLFHLRDISYNYR